MLEAMACGTPLIMGDLPQIREWITHEENGWLVPLQDKVLLRKALEKALRDGHKDRARFAEYNRALVMQKANAQEQSKKIRELIVQQVGKLT